MYKCLGVYFGVDQDMGRRPNAFRGKHFSHLILFSFTLVSSANAKEISLKVRKSVPGYSKEFTKKINTQKVALLLMDVWNYPYYRNPRWLTRVERHKEEVLFPLIELFRKSGIPIIHADYGPESHKEERIKIQDEDIQITYTEIGWNFQVLKLRDELYKRGIDTIFYAGYETSRCVYFRPVGLYNMHQEAHLNVILIRDATIAQEYNDSITGQFGKKTFVYMTEELVNGSTTTSNNIREALGFETLPKKTQTFTIKLGSMLLKLSKKITKYLNELTYGPFKSPTVFSDKKIVMLIDKMTKAKNIKDHKSFEKIYSILTKAGVNLKKDREGNYIWSYWPNFNDQPNSH